MKKKSAPEKPATKIVRRVTLTRMFGPPPLLEGEDEAAYNALLARISNHIGPQDILEEIWVRELADMAWEGFRWRRLKAIYLSHRTYGKSLLPNSLIPLEDEEIKPSEGTEPTDEEKEVLRATALADSLDDIYRIEQMSASAGDRRNAILHEIERHRQTLGKALRRPADQPVDADFKVITPGRLKRDAA